MSGWVFYPRALARQKLSLSGHAPIERSGRRPDRRPVVSFTTRSRYDGGDVSQISEMAIRHGRVRHGNTSHGQQGRGIVRGHPMKRAIVAASTGILLSAAGLGSWQTQMGKTDTTPMHAIAERYVKTVLALGQHDKDYVDAYYGPTGVEAGVGRRESQSRRDCRAGTRRPRGSRQDRGRERRDGSSSPSIPRPAARGTRGPSPNHQRANGCRSTRSPRRSTTRSRRRILTRTSSRSSTRSRSGSPVSGSLVDALRRVAAAVRHPTREARRRVSNAPSRRAASGR